MPSRFSVPKYPGAIGYTIDYSDPTTSNPFAPTAFGPWNVLVSNASSQSDFFDATGDDRFRLYRVAPIITSPSDGVTPVTLRPYQPFSAEQLAESMYRQYLFDPQITSLIPAFRNEIGDHGEDATASTEIEQDTGAGDALLQFDGSQTVFALADVDTTQPNILEYSVVIVKNGKNLIPNTDFSVQWDEGKVTFAETPNPGDTVDISYKEVSYTNAQLAMALQNAVDALATVGINGYGTADDNNVKVVNGVIGTPGLRSILFGAAMKHLNRAMIRKISERARSYKTADFSIDTAPGRLIDGMSTQSGLDFTELRAMANQYIKSATSPRARDMYLAFFDVSGILPIFNTFAGMFYGMGYSYYM